MELFGQIPQLSDTEMWGFLFALIFEAFDMLVGVVAALVSGTFSSTKMREGLGHKAMITLVLCLAVLAQTAAALVGDLGFTVPVVLPVCTFIIVMEIGSVIETISAACPELSSTGIFKLFKKEDK